MKKQFLIILIGAMLTCSALAGCGSDSNTEIDEVVETEQEVVEEDTEEAVSEEQTETAEEVSGTWFENSGLVFSDVPEFSFLSSNYMHIPLDEMEAEDVEINATIVVTSSEMGDGTKKIIATMAFTPWTGEDGLWGVLANDGFIDQYTGTSIVTSCADGGTYSTEIEYQDQIYPISVTAEYISHGGYSSPDVRTVTVTCPMEYDGAAFFVFGSDEEIENTIEIGVFDSFENIEHGNYDILLFEGVDTEVEDTAETEDAQEEKTEQESTGAESETPVSATALDENTNSESAITETPADTDSQDNSASANDDSGLIYDENGNIVGGVVFGD